jgi:hypothetical protein
VPVPHLSTYLRAGTAPQELSSRIRVTVGGRECQGRAASLEVVKEPAEVGVDGQPRTACDVDKQVKGQAKGQAKDMQGHTARRVFSHAMSRWEYVPEAPSACAPCPPPPPPPALSLRTLSSASASAPAASSSATSSAWPPSDAMCNAVRPTWFHTDQRRGRRYTSLRPFALWPCSPTPHKPSPQCSLHLTCSRAFTGTRPTKSSRAARTWLLNAAWCRADQPHWATERRGAHRESARVRNAM